MIKDSGFRLRTVALFACCGALLVGCGGGSSTTTPEKTQQPQPTPPTPGSTESATEESAQDKQLKAITAAVTAAQTAVPKVTDTATDTQVTEADEAITALETAIRNGTDLPEDDTTFAIARGTLTTLKTTLDNAKTSRTATQTAATTAQQAAMQRTAITDAVANAEEAIAAVEGNDATDNQVTEADEAITELNTAIDNAGALPETEIQAFRGTLKALTGRRDAAKTSREAAQNAQTQAQMQRDMEAAKAEAKKMFGAIFPYNPTTPSAVGGAQYNTSTALEVTNRTDANTPPTANPTPITLTEDNNAMLTYKLTSTKNEGWDAKKYTDKDSDGNIIAEAVVYADLETTVGLKFGSTEDDDEFKYKLSEDDPATTDVDESLQFSLQTDNSAVVNFSATTAAEVRITESIKTDGTTTVGENTKKREYRGSYNGVAGRFICPEGPTVCEATATGTLQVFTLNSAWRFKVGNKNQRVTEPPDESYASYGRWIHMPPGAEWTASAFHDYRAATRPDPENVTDVVGSATYEGGATGWYALSSDTDGTNDSDSFTASVELIANFSTDTITGKIENFKDGDEKMKPWKVDLSAAVVTGSIAPGSTAWTIDGTKGDCDTQCTWGGTFYEPDDPATAGPTVLTGYFYTKFGKDGKMVGSFGTKKKK